MNGPGIPESHPSISSGMEFVRFVIRPSIHPELDRWKMGEWLNGWLTYPSISSGMEFVRFAIRPSIHPELDRWMDGWMVERMVERMVEWVGDLDKERFVVSTFCLICHPSIHPDLDE